MMNDSISRQMAIDALSAILDNPNHAEFLYGDEICKTLQDLPSVERRGRWEKIELYAPSGDYVMFQCSECASLYFETSSYCPNCGAKMSEVENE